MVKPVRALMMIAAILALSAPARAEDEGEADPNEASTPEAAEASRVKGYKAEKPKPGAPDAEDEAPIESRTQPKTSITLPPQRPLGAAERRAAASGGGASTGSGAGISCEKSVPPLTRVIREERPNLVRDTNKVEYFTFGPNEAISYKFTAQKTGSGGFGTEEATRARRESTLMSVSETPCDFDAEKALTDMDRGPTIPRGKPAPCYRYNIGPGGTIVMVPIGQALPAGTNTASICFVKPGKTYYFNIRSFSADDWINKRGYRDACAESAKTMGPNLKCGGIWQYIGQEVAGAKEK